MAPIPRGRIGSLEGNILVFNGRLATIGGQAVSGGFDFRFETGKKSLDVSAQCVDRIAALHHDQHWQSERCNTAANRSIVVLPQPEEGDWILLKRVGSE